MFVFKPGASQWSRLLSSMLVGLLLELAPTGVAHADPAEPSDYQSVIVAVTPSTDAIRLHLIGDGSLVELHVRPGSEVIVDGYRGEPYLRVEVDGRIEENLRSPATYLNRSRLGGSVPDSADPGLPPQWKTVATDGSYAWHDHRTHWMGGDPPPGTRPGDQVQTGRIRLLVDGAPVQVTVATYWLGEPSRTPLVLGAAAGAALLLGSVLLRRRLVWPLLAVSVAALAIGWWQYRSLPAETGPLVSWWLLPAIAVTSAVAASALGHRLLAHALAVLAALELAVWVYVRRAAAVRATIPTDAPFWLDRATMAATAIVATVVTVAGVVAMMSSPTTRRWPARERPAPNEGCNNPTQNG
jgi:hypothetical protein